jgi:glycosyltransferase involved in cell wall biosynthesis
MVGVGLKIGLVVKPERSMTGLRRYAESLYESLRAQGVDVKLLCPRTPVPGAAGWMGKRLELDPAAFFGTYPLSVRLNGATVCHLASQTLATLLLLRRLPPTVVTVHDIIPYLVRADKRLNTYRHGLERLMYRLALWGLRRADALIAISEYTKRTVVDALGYSAERIHMVYCAVDSKVFRPMPVPLAFRQRYGLEEGGAYVLYVGTEDPRKNLEALIRALALVRQQVPSARLVKAGAAQFGSERVRLLQLVEKLGLEGSVRFLDEVPEEDLPLLYNAAHVFVLPSLYEGFGMPALEAMSCGTPVIASKRASLPEVVGEGGVLVEPSDTEALAERLGELLVDRELHNAAAEAARRQAARFSPARQAAMTLQVYKKVSGEL